MRKLLLWLVMVAVMVAAILGGTAAFLYSRTGGRPPQEPVQFGDITLESTAGTGLSRCWVTKSQNIRKAHKFDRAETGHFHRYHPQLTLPAWVTSATVQITAPDGTAWSGDKSSCNTYTYAQNGDYQIIVTAYHNDADAPATRRAGTPTAPGSRWP